MLKIFKDMLNNSHNINLDKSEKFWDDRAEEFNNKAISGDKAKDFNDIISFISQDNKNLKFGEVLDIGCGPGKYAVEFSKIADKVTAIDISQNMINFGVENAKKLEINNIEFLKNIWSEIDLAQLDWKNKFDLVFASMSPAISDYETIIKMNEASKNLCFMSGFVKRKDFLRDKLGSVLLEEYDKNFQGNKIYSAFNILWQMGYCPKIIYKDKVWLKQDTVDKMLQYYKNYFSMTKNLKLEDEEIIKEFIESNSVDGIVTEKIQSKIAWMCWEV